MIKGYWLDILSFQYPFFIDVRKHAYLTGVVVLQPATPFFRGEVKNNKKWRYALWQKQSQL